MIVSSQLFEDYIECATKCWLRSRAEPAAGNIYAEWARVQNEAYRQDALKKLLAGGAKINVVRRDIDEVLLAEAQRFIGAVRNRQRIRMLSTRGQNLNRFP